MVTVLLVAVVGLLGAVVLGSYFSSPSRNQHASMTAIDHFRPFQ